MWVWISIGVGWLVSLIIFSVAALRAWRQVKAPEGVPHRRQDRPRVLHATACRSARRPGAAADGQTSPEQIALPAPGADRFRTYTERTSREESQSWTWHLQRMALDHRGHRSFVALFGAAKLPIFARSLGQSMRIFKSEVRGLKEDDEAAAAPAAGDRRRAARRRRRPPRPPVATPAAAAAPQVVTGANGKQYVMTAGRRPVLRPSSTDRRAASLPAEVDGADQATS